MNSDRYVNVWHAATGSAFARLGWVVLAGLTSSCMDGGSGAEAVGEIEAPLQGPTASSIEATGGWRRPLTVNYTVFDYGSLLACAVPGGSTGPGNISCGATLCPTNTFTFGCDSATQWCLQSTSNGVSCWNRNGEQQDLPFLSSHIQSVMIGKLGTQTRAVGALTEDGVLHWSTGTASDTPATFHAGLNTWSAVIPPIDDNGNSVCLKKIAAIDIPNQLGIEAHILGLSCSNKLLVHAMSPSGAWSPAELSLQPWTLLPANLSWQDISHYNPTLSGWRGAAILLSTTGQVWRVGRAQFSASGVRNDFTPGKIRGSNPACS